MLDFGAGRWGLRQRGRAVRALGMISGGPALAVSLSCFSVASSSSPRLRSYEGLTFETSTLECLYGGRIALSSLLIKPTCK